MKFTQPIVRTSINDTIPNVPASIGIRDIANTLAYFQQYSERTSVNNTSRNTAAADAIVTGILFTLAGTTAFPGTNVDVSISGGISLSPNAAGAAGAVSLSLFHALDPSAAPVDGDLSLYGSPLTFQNQDPSKIVHHFHFSYSSIATTFYYRWRLKVSHAGAISYNIALGEMSATFRIRPCILGAS